MFIDNPLKAPLFLSGVLSKMLGQLFSCYRRHDQIRWTEWLTPGPIFILRSLWSFSSIVEKMWCSSGTALVPVYHSDLT